MMRILAEKGCELMINNKNKKTLGNVTVYFKTSQIDTFEIINSTVDQAAKFVKDR